MEHNGAYTMQNISNTEGIAGTTVRIARRRFCMLRRRRFTAPVKYSARLASCNESSLNVYGIIPKFLLDQYVWRLGPAQAMIAGFRYFNVYGDRRANTKGRMARLHSTQSNLVSRAGQGQVVRRLRRLRTRGAAARLPFRPRTRLPSISIFWTTQIRAGIFNVGTGRKPVASTMLSWRWVNSLRQTEGKLALSLDAMRQQGPIAYIPFPTLCAESTKVSPRRTSPRCAGPGYKKAVSYKLKRALLAMFASITRVRTGPALRNTAK